MNLEQAITAFDGAVLAPARWGDALESVAQACGARMATLVASGPEGSLTCSRGARDAIDLYLHRREVPDSRHHRVQPTLAGGFRTDFDDFTPREIAADPYYQEFLAPLDVRWHAAAALPGRQGPVVLSLKRAARQGPFEGAELDALNRMLPALRRAARLAAVLGQTRIDGELAAFAHLRRGALCLDAAGCIVARNHCVAFGDGLLDDGRRLGAARPADRDALRRAVATALGGRASPPVVVHRTSGRRPLVVDVLPLPALDLGAPGGHCALALVHDPETRPLPTADLLQRAYALAPREAELALQLAAGATLRDAAAALGISELHARQRLKVVFAKTGTARQSELALLVARMA